MSVRTSARRMGAVLALSTMVVIGTAGVAAARDYPPSSVDVKAASVTPAAAATSTDPTTGGLPFTGGNDVELVWVGVAFAGAGALAVAKTRRSHKRA